MSALFKTDSLNPVVGRWGSSDCPTPFQTGGERKLPSLGSSRPGGGREAIAVQFLSGTG